MSDHGERDSPQPSPSTLNTCKPGSGGTKVALKQPIPPTCTQNTQTALSLQFPVINYTVIGSQQSKQLKKYKQNKEHHLLGLRCAADFSLISSCVLSTLQCDL